MLSVSFFFFNDTATTEIYTLSLHDALPISSSAACSSGSPSSRWTAMKSPVPSPSRRPSVSSAAPSTMPCWRDARSEEHTSELQSHLNLVCRLLLEKKKHNTPLCPPRHAPHA